MTDQPYEWQPIEKVPKDGTEVILYFSTGSCRVPCIARYREGALDSLGVPNWERVECIPGPQPTGWLPIIYKD
jgi:hypothetical protein